MSSRRYHDPTEAAALTASLVADLNAATALLSERDRLVIIKRFGLSDGEPRTLGELAAELGVSKSRIREIEANALSRLRHPYRSRRLRDHLDDDLPDRVLREYLADTIATHALHAADQQGDLVFCDRHGWTMGGHSSPTCANCPCAIGSRDGAGRPRRYCSSRCRQASYRLRVREAARKPS